MRYLIKLKPLTPFFFGSEKTFGEGKNQNYFAKSNPFPQQTTVLGMLRKELLIQAQLFKEHWNCYTPKDKQKIEDLIGKPFRIKINNQNNFGKIKKLSPVFIECKDEFYIRRPLFDSNFEFKEITGQTFLNKSMKHIPFIKNYSPKEGLPDGFVASDSKNEKTFEEIFKDFVKVGNAKDKSEDDEDKFFKQLFYTLSEDCSFAFFAELDFDLNPAVVFMGADNSAFKMQVQEANQSFDDLFVNQSEPGKITLLSDALVDEKIYEHCKFAITQIVDFRTIAMNYGKFDKKNNEKYEMLEPGSVLYYSDGQKSEIQKLLDNASLQQIGYNIYR